MSPVAAKRVFIHAVALSVGLLAFLPGRTSTAQNYFQKGLKVGPEYCRPVAPVAPGWIDERDPQVQIHSDWRSREQYWWTSFNDPVLSSLIENAYGQNLTLRAAGMRILTAQAQRDIVTGELFPQAQNLFGGYQRIAESRQSGNNQGAAGNRFFSDWVLGGQLAWELDFWGKFRRSVTAANARLDARIEDYDDVLVLLVADVAATYVEIRTLDQRLVFARRNLEIQNESVRLAQKKFDAGARESQLDLPQAQSNLAEVTSLIPDLLLARRRAMNRLCVLLGMPPANIEALLGQGGIPTPPPDIAIGIPADLLRQRPDVRRSERELAAQCEEIGIAVANLYPHISIHGTLFVNAEHFADLFKSSAFAGAVGPTFRWDVLNYGRLRGRIREQEAIFNELLYNYQQTVLRANEEAENAIALFLLSHEKVVALEAGAAASLTAVNLGLQRYEDGLADFNRLSNVQLDLARQQDDLAFAQGQIAQGWIEVYRSLGGGWQIRLANARPYMPGIEQPATDTPDELPAAEPAEPAPENVPAQPNHETNESAEEKSNQTAAQDKDPLHAPESPSDPPLVEDDRASASITETIARKLAQFRKRWTPTTAPTAAAPSVADNSPVAENQAAATPPPSSRLTEARPLRTPLLLDDDVQAAPRRQGSQVAQPESLMPSQAPIPQNARANQPASKRARVKTNSSELALKIPDLLANTAVPPQSTPTTIRQHGNHAPSQTRSAAPPSATRIATRSARVRDPQTASPPRKRTRLDQVALGPGDLQHPDFLVPQSVKPVRQATLHPPKLLPR